MITDTKPKPKLRKGRLLGWVALALLASGSGFAFVRLKAALDERATLPESLDRLEGAGLAIHQELRTLQILDELLEQSTQRIALLTAAGTSPGAAPLPDEDLARWTRNIADERTRVQNDQGLLSQLARGTTGPMARMVETLRQQLGEEDHAWEIVGRYLNARHDATSAVREDELLREFVASLMKIGQSVADYRERLREAAAANSRMAHEDDARLSVLLAVAARSQQAIALYLTLSIGTLLLLAIGLVVMNFSSRAGGKRLPPDGAVRV
jgi:hypothetical protein